MDTQTIHPVYTDGPEQDPLFFIVPSDGSAAYCLGEMHEVKELWQKLGRLISLGQHDGILDSHDEQRVEWIDAKSASLEFGVPKRTIAYACAHGHIRGAKKQGREWRMPVSKVRYWATHRPKPGPKSGG
jgi:hypothetical protein